MATRSIQQLTFREKIRDSAQIIRELVEHLERGFLPKVGELQGKVKVRPGVVDDFVPDVTIRSLAAEVLESERFTAQVDERLGEYGASIVEEVERIFAHGA